jgi:hypothetical protein
LVNINKLASSHAEVELGMIRDKYLIRTHIWYHYFLEGIVDFPEIAEAVNEWIYLKLFRAFGLV